MIFYKMVEQMASKLKEEKSIYKQVVGLYTPKIYKIARSFASAKSISAASETADNPKLYDLFIVGIVRALESEKFIRKEMLEDKATLQRIFPKFILPKCKEAMQKERNIYLPLTIPKSISKNYIEAQAKTKGLSLEKFMELPLSSARGCVDIKHMHNTRAFSYMRENYLRGVMESEIDENIFYSTYTDLIEEDEEDIKKVSLCEYSLLGGEMHEFVFSASYHIEELFKHLTKEEIFIVVALFFEEIPIDVLANIYIHSIGVSGSSPIHEIKNKLEKIYTKLREVVKNDN